MFWCWLVLKNMKKWNKKYMNRNRITVYRSITWQTRPSFYGNDYLVCLSLGIGLPNSSTFLTLQPPILLWPIWLELFLTEVLEQFSVRWRVDLWLAVFLIICKEEQTMRQRGGLPTSPLRCVSQWAILESIESREFSLFSAHIQSVFCTWGSSLFIST
jgi:hypothetical protein